MGRVYHWRNFTDNKYIDLVDEETEINIHTISDEINFDANFLPLCNYFLKKYNSFQIPKDIESKLDELFLKYNIINLKPNMLLIGCALQYSYSINFGITKDELLEDFDSTSKDFKELLKTLKEYLFSENLKRLPDVSFKTLTNGTINIKNFFVKWDIYDALCDSFDLTKENFEERSQDLLKMTNKVILDKYPEKVKVDFIQNIFKYLVENKILKRADTLIFIGVFFKLFQVKVNNNESELEIYDTLEDNINSIDPKNLNHYITRPPKLFHY